MSVELEVRTVGDVAVQLGWVEDWFRCNYVEAQILLGEVPKGPVLYRHRYIDETVQVPSTPERIAARINRRSRRWSQLELMADGAKLMRHRKAPVPCSWSATLVNDRLTVDAIGETVSLDELVTVIRCRTCHRTASLNSRLRGFVVGAPFTIGGYLSPTMTWTLP